MEYRVALKQLPPSVRPRERLISQGARELSEDQLLAIILRTGHHNANVLQLSQHLLKEFQGLGGLEEATVEELCRLPGIGPVKAVELKAAFELGRRLASTAADERRQIRCPGDVKEYMGADLASLGQEELWVILLNTKNRILGKEQVYKGSVDTAQARIGELFRAAVKKNSKALILVHNHPSGDPSPSNEDVALTRQVVEAGRLLDIEVLDHVIIGRSGFVSLKERGLGFGSDRAVRGAAE